jgi:hypothetical protein
LKKTIRTWIERQEPSLWAGDSWTDNFGNGKGEKTHL